MDCRQGAHQPATGAGCQLTQQAAALAVPPPPPLYLRLQELHARILTEAGESERRGAVLAARWEPLTSLEVPEELWAALEAQRGDCEARLARHDALVAGAAGALRV